MAKNYVTPGEAARILGVWDRTLRYWEEQGKLQQSEQQGDREDMTSPHIQLGLPGIGLSSSMPESHQPSKRKICSVNVNVRLVPTRSL